MLDKFCVYCDGQEAGTVEIKKEGLYYCFYGKLALAKNKIWRVIASSEDGEIDLGICLFEDPYYILSRKIPAKYMSGEHWSFKAVCPDDQRKKIISVSEDQPFEQLERITDGVYSTEEGSGIIFNGNHGF